MESTNMYVNEKGIMEHDEESKATLVSCSEDDIPEELRILIYNEEPGTLPHFHIIHPKSRIGNRNQRYPR